MTAPLTPDKPSEELSHLYNPSIQDLELDEHQGIDRAVVYLDQAEVALQTAIDTAVDQAAKEAAAIFKHHQELRHIVNVGHWESSCGNCSFNGLAGSEMHCPQCKFAFHGFTTDYPNEVEIAQAVFPHLEYFNQFPELSSFTPPPVEQDPKAQE